MTTGSTTGSTLGKATVSKYSAREILTRTNGFLKTYDFTINPHQGCTFGCTYCYAAFFVQDQKQQDSWGNWVRIKENGPELMAAHRPGSLDGKRIYMSSVTDPYQPIERTTMKTRGILESLVENHRPKLVVQTRSPLVTRDLDLFARIEEKGGRVQVNMTVTTDDEDVRKTFEPGCPSGAARLKAIREIQQAGIQTCVTITPMLLILDPEAFAESLLDTGVKRFITQSFHFSDEGLIAQTREAAFRIMAEKLECNQQEFRTKYTQHYRRAREVLRDRLPSLGEGRQGFAPPF